MDDLQQLWQAAEQLVETNNLMQVELEVRWHHSNYMLMASLKEHFVVLQMMRD
jgi:hypothetical protein